MYEDGGSPHAAEFTKDRAELHQMRLFVHNYKARQSGKKRAEEGVA